MRRLLIQRCGGYGDFIQMSAVLPFLFDRYESVSIECDTKGHELFWNDHRFDSLYLWEPWNIDEKERDNRTIEHWLEAEKKFPDHEIMNFVRSVEGECLTWDVHPDFDLPKEERERRFNKGFYESQFKRAKVEMPKGWMHDNTIFFSREEEYQVGKWKEKNKDYFNLVLALAGSSLQKVFPTWMEGFCRRLIRELPKLKIWLMGDRDASEDVWECERTVNLIARMGFKQSLHMTKYADYVLGGETGLLVGAGMFGTPKTILFTIANKHQLVDHHRNDFSLQSKAECSPCYALAYTAQKCPHEPVYNIFPACTHEWDRDEIFTLIERQYASRF